VAAKQRDVGRLLYSNRVFICVYSHNLQAVHYCNCNGNDILTYGNSDTIVVAGFRKAVENESNVSMMMLL
jgi:hypothetical protein